MCHDAYARRILVDEDVVRSSMRALSKDVFWFEVGARLGAAVGFDGGEGQDSGHYWILEPLRKRRVEQSVLDKVGRPGLQSTMGELFPPRLRGASNLRRHGQ